MIGITILSILSLLMIGISLVRLREMLVAREANVRGTIWRKSVETKGYWFWVSLMAFFALAGVAFAVLSFVAVAHGAGLVP